MLLTVLSLIFPVVMVFAMVSDFRHFEIPNSLSLILLSAYPLAAIIGGLSWQTILWAFALGALVLVVMMLAFGLGLMGGGDCKLIAAAVLWTGTEQLVEFLLITSIAGGILSLSLLLFRRLRLPAVLSGMPTMQRMHAGEKKVPYAVAIAAAGLMVYPHLPILDG
jgi:prepilin peptidase CpaA